jgi:patatin-like phospholipase/acyl hydrolase
MATVQLLRELEARSGRRVQDMFDLICGTSTGGLLAVALGLRHLSLDDCEHIYKVLGQKVGPARRRGGICLRGRPFSHLSFWIFGCG